MNKKVYEAEEDTFLLLDVLKKYLSSQILQFSISILEIGVGSGYILSNLEKSFPRNSYYGTDINKEAVIMTKNACKNSEVMLGNLFEPFQNNKFDIIYFNTPYLPCENNEKYEDLEIIDKAIYGGKKGYEVIINFLDNVRNHMKKDSRVFMLFSTRSKPHVIDEYLEKNAFNYTKVGSKEVFFEEIIVYEITNKEVIKELIEKGVSHFSYLSKGKHSIVLNGKYNNNNIVCKIERNNFVGKEGFFLEKLQEYDFIPKLFFYTQNYIVMEKIEGTILDDIYKKNYSFDQISMIFNSILKATQILDTLGFQKFEMLNPYKHIFIQENLQIKFIDFERMIYSKNPKNTTQFLEYIRRKKEKLKKWEIYIDEKKIKELARDLKISKNSIRIEELIK